MHIQTTLFEQPLSHTRDPITSFEAADKLVKSGKLNQQERIIWQAITKLLCKHSPVSYFNFTARELSVWAELNYWMVQRRLSGLHNKGKIERTGEKRDGCMVWKLKGN